MSGVAVDEAARVAVFAATGLVVKLADACSGASSTSRVGRVGGGKGVVRSTSRVVVVSFVSLVAVVFSWFGVVKVVGFRRGAWGRVRWAYHCR